MHLTSGNRMIQQQGLALAPLAIQSIKILQLGTQELHDFLREEAEKNPLLHLHLPRPAETARFQPGSRNPGGAVSHSLPGAARDSAQPTTLRTHLEAQAGLTFRDPADRIVASEIIGALDPDGYLRRPTVEIADILDTREAQVLTVLRRIQEFEPTGVAARDLAECLRLQLRENGDLTDAMCRLLDNLPLLARYDLDRLADACGTGRDAIPAMVARLRRLDPAPGRRFDAEPMLPALPDILVEPGQEGEIRVVLNSETLPRALVDRDYLARLRTQAKAGDDRKFIADRLRNATWLVQNLDRRAKTLLRVATEIASRQHAYFRHGRARLVPLCMREVADATGVHESTVCRAVANKYLLGPEGLVALKFFFSEALAATDGGAQHAGAAVRHRIGCLIDAETPRHVLSDDAIVAELRRDGIDIARRTVAKYRAMLRIPASSIRRRMKRAPPAPAD